MIKIQELRIGNNLMRNNTIRTVTSIDRSKFTIPERETCTTAPIEQLRYEEEIQYYEMNELEPIPIVGHILVRAGFKAFGTEGAYEFDRLIINLSDFSIAIDDKPIPLLAPKFLHQLQNIYFEFTGQAISIQ